MTHDALKEAAAVVMKSAKKRLARTGSLAINVVYVLPNGDVIKEETADPALINNGPARAILFDMMRNRIQELKAEAVIWTSDIWYLDSSPAIYQERIREIGIENFRALTDRLGVVASANQGFGIAREAINLVLQTYDWTYCLVQFYARRGSDQSHIVFLQQDIHDMGVGDDKRAVGRGVQLFKSNVEQREKPCPDALKFDS